MISYFLYFSNKHAHIFDVTLAISRPNPKGQVLTLPAWIPGSYMIRDFAKNIVSLKCLSEGKPVRCLPLDKQTWQVEPVAGELEVVYQVYAFDLSVRTAYLDDERAFFNGSSVFLAAQGLENHEHELTIVQPTTSEASDESIDESTVIDTAPWSVNTTLKPVQVDSLGYGVYYAQNYDELIDHPVEIADVEHAAFDLDGVKHELIITGHKGSDLAGMIYDIEKICRVHCELFGGYPKDSSLRDDENQRYQFLTMVVDNGYGGLEHRHSTALLCARKDLLRYGEKAQGVFRDDYIQFLGLCSHEYFHTWNIKRIKPQMFLNYQLDKEQYTEDLWFYEGVTSYYDDLALVRSSIISQEKYLDLLSHMITRVTRCEGRFEQTVTESSFYAWSKFYKQDENASNTIVSYYSKGALVALCLDLMIRKHSSNMHTLDTLMRVLWVRTQQGLGTDTADVILEANKLVCDDLSGSSHFLADFWEQALYSTDDLPVAQLLENVGVDMQMRARVSATDKGGATKVRPPQSYLGIDVSESAGTAKIRVCHAKSPAMHAGLSAKDSLVAIDNLKASKASVWQLLCDKKPGEQVEFHVFRRDRLLKFTVSLGEPKLDTCVLKLSNSEATKGWLSL